MTIEEFRVKFKKKERVAIAVIGDSTTCGFGANPSSNAWTDGLSYGCVNQPRHGENWNNNNPYYINTSGFPSQEQQDNKGIPSAVRLLRTYIEERNQTSKVYNYGGSGWTAGNHVSNSTVSLIANLVPKPDIVFINLGINSAKNNQSQDSYLRTLVTQCINNNMTPILVKPNNIGVANSPYGVWEATSYPNNWYLLYNWQTYRDNIQDIANQIGVSCIDLGQDNTLGDTTLLYDSFHPSNLGYAKIAEIYKEFVAIKNIISTRDGKYYTALNNGNGAVKIKTTKGTASIPLSQEEISFVRIKANNIIYSFSK